VSCGILNKKNHAENQIRDIEEKVKLEKAGVYKLFRSLPGYTNGAWREYHARPAQKRAEHTSTRAIFIVFSDLLIADHSRFCFFNANPMTRPVAVPAMQPSEIIIRTVNALAVIICP